MAAIRWLADVLRQAGLPVVEHGDWQNRTRPGSFNPIGVLWHHTAATSSPANPAPALDIVINGRSDLPGPLAHALVDYNGVFHVIAAGRCNHAGQSGGSGPIPAGSGNAMLIGWEIDYNGVSQAMTNAQYTNSVRATAAVLNQLGKTAAYARGHRETSVTGKIDPSFVDLDVMRSDVADAMAGSPPDAGMRRGVTGGMAVSWSRGRLDVFGRGGEYQAYQNYFQRTGAAWPAWGAIPGSSGLSVRPVTTSWEEGRLDVFGAGVDKRMRHWYFNGSWNGPDALGNTTFASTPSPVTFESGRVDVFATATDSTVRHSYAVSGGTNWPSWAPLPSSSGTVGPATAVSWAIGRYDVFAVGPSQLMRHWWFDRAGDAVWYGPETLGTTQFVPAGSIAAVSWEPGRLDVFAKDVNGALRHNYAVSGADVWPAWRNLGGVVSSPVAAAWGPGRLDVFASGSGNTMRHWWFDRTGDNIWRGPEVIGSTTFTAQLGIASWAPGRLDVFGIDTNQTMRHNYYERGSASWPGWEHLGGTFN